MEIRLVGFHAANSGGGPMSEGGVRGIDLFKIAGESISGWIPSWKTGDVRPTRQPFCSQLEEQLLLYLEYHPQVAWYGRGDSSATFASTYKITSPLPIPFTINYLFEEQAHIYLPDAIGQLLDGRLLIAEAGLEQDKRRARNRAKAEAARKVAEQQGGVYWIGTEATLNRNPRCAECATRSWALDVSGNLLAPLPSPFPPPRNWLRSMNTADGAWFGSTGTLE
jgi:hypothetical protein